MSNSLHNFMRQIFCKIVGTFFSNIHANTMPSIYITSQKHMIVNLDFSVRNCAIATRVSVQQITYVLCFPTTRLRSSILFLWIKSPLFDIALVTFHLYSNK